MSDKLIHSYVTGQADTQLLYKTIGNLFDQTANKFSNNDGLIVRHQNIRWSYSEYQQHINNLATGLLALGISKGDRVGIWAPNCYEWCLTQFATAKIGAILVCINPAYRLYELEYALNKVECKAIVVAERFKSSEYLKMLETLAPELAQCKPGKLQAEKLPSLNTVIRLGDTKTAGMFNFSDVCKMGGESEIESLNKLSKQLSPDDPINIQFTSGTTGNPKGATLSHFNILNNGKIVGDGMRLTEQDKLCIPVPLYHCFGMVMGNLSCVTHGSTAVFPNESFDPETTLQAIAEERCTAVHGVPTMFIAELEYADFKKFDLSSLRTGIMAGSPCPIEVMKRVLKDMHMSEVLIAYGQTETSPVNHMTAVDDPIDKRVATVGKPGPHLEIKIIDESGNVAAIGDKGEICCRGYSVMKGYWADDEKTQDTIDDAGWLHSGDIGIMDEQGYVQITGRIKDMIIRGGENIYPREIEEYLYTHPNIQEVQIFGVPDKKFGEQICAWVQLQDNSTLTEEDVKDYCRGQISHFKVPNYIQFVNEFPMTVTGKMQKFKMRELACEELEIED